MYWYKEELAFKVHRKENQILKYVNDDSTHTRACRKSIPSGVIHRLTNLTTLLPENQDKKINELYPDHAAALLQAKLTTKEYEYPTLKESLEKIQLQAQ